MKNLFAAAFIFGLFNAGAALALTAPNSAGFSSSSVWTVVDDAGREGVSATTPGSSDPGNVAGTNNHSENPLDKSGTNTDSATPLTPDSDSTKQSDITNKSGNTTN